MRKRGKHVLSLVLSAAMFLSTLVSGTGMETVSAAETKSSYRTVVEFEDANRFEQNGSNRVESNTFSGYSGSGYVYLVSGWGEVGFTVPKDGDYEITVVTNADQHKENWLYLDDNGAGQLNTSGNKWESATNTYYLSAGEHKFGVSTGWGYTALDYVVIESVEQITEEPSEEESSEVEESSSVVESSEVEESSSEEESSEVEESSSVVEKDEFATRFEFEDANRYEQNGNNRVESGTFSGYSGSGYLYLASGWGEVGFDVPTDGEYKITIVTNADSYKENWLYLDNDGAGTLTTSGNKWEEHTAYYDLTAGEHKFGVSTSWGYTALDYVDVELVSQEDSSIEEETTEEETTEEETTVPDIDVEPSGDGMYVKGGNIYDANGNNFIMRGVNVAHDWYRDYTDTTLDAIAGLGSNCARIVLGDGSQYPFIDASEVETIIKKCESLGMICILEVHDYTGSDSVSDLNQAVEYWKNMKDLLNAHKDYVIVNIANEWHGTWNMGATWSSAYQSAIKSMRNAGIENVIMVDAAGWGQEAASCIDYCQSVLSADTTGNTMFSIHMYSVVGKDASTVKSAIDGMLAKGVSFCIGEFGHYQGGGEVDEETIMSYCTEKGIGYVAWSWKGNGGDDKVLDMSSDWAGTNLTDWGSYVFNADGIGIKATSVMPYTLKKYDGSIAEVEKPDTPVEDDTPVVDTPAVDLEGVDAGYLSEYDDWGVAINGDVDVCTVTTSEALSNGGVRVNINLSQEDYPCIFNQVKGVDLSSTSTIDVLVRNNCLKAIQIQPIFKTGDLWEWQEYDRYQTVPANSAVMLSFDVTGCPDLDEVNSMIFRIQGAGSKTAGAVDFYSITSDYDYSADPFAHAVDELNRPKSATYFTWDYPENSWTNTTDFACDANGVITVNFTNVTSEDAAGPQTETCPGMGAGIDVTAFSKVKSTITNNTSKDIHVTLVMKTTGNWTWQENAGTVDGESGERIIPAGESVEVVYEISGSEWKSKASNWAYTGELDGADDLRAIAYKIYANEGETVSGSVEISNFSFEF